jgi:hypothetical protein
MNPNQTTEPIDQVLGDYYKSQLPRHWPDAPQPWSAPEVAQIDRRRSNVQSWRSRWALAASIALILSACWYVSGQFTVGKKKNGIGLEDGTAKMPKELARPSTKIGLP